MRRARSLTFGAYLTTRWLPSKKLELAQSTWDSYRRKIDRHIIPSVGRVPIRRLRPDHLEALYHQRLHSTGERKPLAPKTVLEIHLIIRGALKDALHRGLVSRNVALVAHAPKVRSIPKVEQQAWTAQQLQAFLREAAGHLLFPAFWLSSNTGLRRSELLGLQWDDVDLAAATLSTNRGLVAVGYELHASRGKTSNSRRLIDLDPTNVQVLSVWRDWQQTAQAVVGVEPSRWVFTDAVGTPVHPHSISQTFERIVARAGVPNIRLHDIRHTHGREHQVEGESLDAQVAECLRAASAEGFEVPDPLVFREEGFTGAAASRPTLDALVEAASAGKFSRLCVWKVSRFGRSARNNLNLLEDLKQRGVSVRFVQDGLDTSQRMAGLLFALLSSLAELERENLAEQTMLGKRASARNGRWQGGVVPYGLRVRDASDGRGKMLEVDEDESALLHEVRRRIVEEQITTYQVAHRLNARGVRPKLAHSWSRQLVSLILRNPRLKGEATYSGSPFPMPAVFTNDEYQELQLVLDRRSSPRRPNPGPYLFTGFLRCGCGTHFVGHRARVRRPIGVAGTIPARHPRNVATGRRCGGSRPSPLRELCGRRW